MRNLALVASLALSASTLALPAAPLAAVFANGSFETVTGGSNPAAGTFVELFSGNTDMTGWTVTSGNVDLVNTSYFAPDFVASDGRNSVDLNGSTIGAIAQTFDTVAGAKYRVTFDLNTNPYDGNSSALKTVLVSAGADSGVFSYSNALHPVGAGGPWQSHVFDFTATGASTTLTFQSTTNNCCYGAELDNVALGVAGVPEPAMWAMMMAGFGLMGLTLRRRQPVATAA